MADIKVAIKGDDSDLKAKFKESSAEANAFKENVEKSLDAIKAASQNVVSQTGLGGIAKLLGAAGLAGAAVEFSNVLVKGFKDAVTAALDFGAQIGKLRAALGTAFAGQAEAWAEKIQSISGVMGGFEENMAIFAGLVRTGLIPDTAFKNLIDIQNAAKSLGVGVDELGEKFVEMRSEGEVPPRMFREMPALAARVRQMLPAGGPAAAPGATPEEGLAARVKAAGGADWLFKTVLPAIAPGGLQAPARFGAETSTRGQFMGITEEFNKLWRELGTDLLPVVNEALRGLKTEMPDIIKSFHELGEELKVVVPVAVKALHFFFGRDQGTLLNPSHPFGQPLKPIHDYLESVENNIFTLFQDPIRFLKEAAAEHKEAAEALHRAVNPR
jgi:hypothetical protein